MSPASPMSSSQFFAALKMRRSVYSLKPSSPISDAAIRELVETAINLAPTAYNSQLSRVALVFGEKNKRMWDAMWAANQKTFPTPELEAQVHNKWKHAYMSSYGSLVFFDDTKALKEICEKMPKSADVLPIWTTNGQGILQVTMWTALATEGLGANLQHFPQVTPGADEAMRTVLDDVPEFWRCSAVMPFGEIVEHPAEKTKLPMSERLKVYLD